MSWKKTLVLLLVLAVIGGYYAYFELKYFPEKERREEEAKKIFAVKPEEVAEIVLKKGDKRISCVRKGGKWEITDPVKDSGDENTFKTLTRTIAGLKPAREVEKNPKDLKVFGLDPPKLEVKVRKRGEKVYRVLYIGDQNPTRGYVYAKMKGSPGVFLLSFVDKADIDKKLYDLRNKNVLRFETDKVAGIEFQSKGEELVVATKKADGTWTIEKPLKASADSDKFDSLLRNLKNWKIKKFVSENAVDLAKYGLNDPQYMVSLKVDETPSIKTLIIGKEEKKEKGVYAMVKGSQRVVFLESSILKNLPKKLYDVRDKAVVKFDKDDIVKVCLKYRDRELELVKKSENLWEMTKPRRLKADRYEVNNLLWELLDLEVKEFLDKEQPAPEIHGIDDPWLLMKLWKKDEKEEPIVVALGNKTGDGEGVYVKAGKGGPVNIVDVKALEKFNRTEFSMRFKGLTDFQTVDVKYIDFVYNGEEYSIKKEDNRWRLEKPEKLRLDNPSVYSVLWAIQDLEFEKIIAEDPKKVPEGAFKKLRLIIEVKNKKKESLGRIEIGARIPGSKLYYARSSISPAAVSLEDDLTPKVRKLVKNIKKKIKPI